MRILSLCIVLIIVGFGIPTQAEECRHGMTVALQSPSPDATRCLLSELPELESFFCLDEEDPVCRFLRDEVAGHARIQCIRRGAGYCASVVAREEESRDRELRRNFLIAWDDGHALDGALQDPRYTGDPVALRVWAEWAQERALIFDPKDCPQCAYLGTLKVELVSRGFPKHLTLQNQHVTFDPKMCTVSASVKAKGSVYKVKSFQLGAKACGAEKKYWAK